MLTAFVVIFLAAGCGPRPQGFDVVSGETIAAADLAGRWLAINYWAQWCGPCRHEIPELNVLDAERADVLVLGVNFDAAQPAETLTVAGEMGIEFAVLSRDPAPRFGYAMPTVLPTTVLVSPAGDVHEVLVGPQTRETIEAALTSKP